MASNRAPKQWTLSKTETVNSFENWRQNLQYVLSLDQNFAPFLSPDVSWDKKGKKSPTRGFVDDANTVTNAKTAQQKVVQLEMCLGQIANFCPIISRRTIVDQSTSVSHIWQLIRAHFDLFINAGSNHLHNNQFAICQFCCMHLGH